MILLFFGLLVVFVLCPLALAWMTWCTFGLRGWPVRTGIFLIYAVLLWDHFQIKH